MKSLLDNSYSWILQRLEYAGNLDIYLQELKEGEPQNAVIGNSVMESVRPIRPEEASLIVKISFADILSWQCLEESATTGFREDACESPGFISILSSSRYLDYLLSNHGWYVEFQNRPIKHYRIWSEHEIFDVVSFKAPAIERVNA